MATCPANCGAEIYFMPNDKSGKYAPVDLHPVADGNVTIDFDKATYHVMTKNEIANLESPGLFMDGPIPQRFQLHFVDCPNAESFRSCRKCHRTPCQCGGEV